MDPNAITFPPMLIGGVAYSMTRAILTRPLRIYDRAIELDSGKVPLRSPAEPYRSESVALPPVRLGKGQNEPVNRRKEYGLTTIVCVVP